jgi:hypothetical protein
MKSELIILLIIIALPFSFLLWSRLWQRFSHSEISTPSSKKVTQEEPKTPTHLVAKDNADKVKRE